jgi:hypothetical protein
LWTPEVYYGVCKTLELDPVLGQMTPDCVHTSPFFENHVNIVRYEVLTAVTVKNTLPECDV